MLDHLNGCLDILKRNTLKYKTYTSQWLKEMANYRKGKLYLGKLLMLDNHDYITPKSGN